MPYKMFQGFLNEASITGPSIVYQWSIMEAEMAMLAMRFISILL